MLKPSAMQGFTAKP